MLLRCTHAFSSIFAEFHLTKSYMMSTRMCCDSQLVSNSLMNDWRQRIGGKRFNEKINRVKTNAKFRSCGGWKCVVFDPHINSAGHKIQLNYEKQSGKIISLRAAKCAWIGLVERKSSNMLRNAKLIVCLLLHNVSSTDVLIMNFRFKCVMCGYGIKAAAFFPKEREISVQSCKCFWNLFEWK